MIRFDHFMAESLYGENGYYTSPRTILGRRGDFTTTPKLTDSLAKAFAAWIKQEWKNHGTKLSVIELGPGDGSLAAGIFEQIGYFSRRSLDYHLVEISPHLRERQLSAITGKNTATKATAHQSLSAALATTGPEALIISNEFFDAFPVRIFRREQNRFSELHLEGLTEHWLPSQNHPQSSLFDKNWPLGQRLEVAESIRSWIHQELSLLKRGSLLTIDYGDTLEHLYHRRPMGSLRAYAHHQLLLPPEAYRNSGKQDLTFDINFTDLSEWGREIGITPVSIKTQSSFTQGHGLGLNPEADQAFKVLYQTRVD